MTFKKQTIQPKPNINIFLYFLNIKNHIINSLTR